MNSYSSLLSSIFRQTAQSLFSETTSKHILHLTTRLYTAIRGIEHSTPKFARFQLDVRHLYPLNILQLYPHPLLHRGLPIVNHLRLIHMSRGTALHVIIHLPGRCHPPIDLQMTISLGYHCRHHHHLWFTRFLYLHLLSQVPYMPSLSSTIIVLMDVSSHPYNTFFTFPFQILMTIAPYQLGGLPLFIPSSHNFPSPPPLFFTQLLPTIGFWSPCIQVMDEPLYYCFCVMYDNGHERPLAFVFY